MRKLKLYIISLIVILSNSCDTLDLGAIDNYSLNNYWNTVEQCERFITGLHVRMRGQMEDFLIMGEMRGGLFKNEIATSVGQNTHNLPIVSNRLSAMEPGLKNWGGFYADIYQINHAIDKISNSCEFLTQEQRNTFLGQLYGIRAYYYFHLFRTWGGVPLCDYPDILETSDLVTLNKARATEIETFEFIKKDIDLSMKAYQDIAFKKYNNSTAYWNKAATYCLFSEIYLWGAKVRPIKGEQTYSTDVKGDLEKAYQALIEVKKVATPLTSFADIFKNKDNTELFFALRYQIGEATNVFANFTYPAASFTGFVDAKGKPLSDPINVGGGALRYEWNYSFFEGLNDNDQRKKATFFDFYKINDEGDFTEKGLFLNKFIGEEQNGLRYYSNDWPIYRYMDAVLMLAEVANELDDHVTVKVCIDEVRERAYSKTKMPVFTYTTKIEAEKVILAERDIEFIAEGRRWYDLRRMLKGKLSLELVNDNEYHLLWPIDKGVLSTDSKVKQTEGYE